jgi:hypothetical protein
MISTDDLDAAGFVSASDSGLDKHRDRPYLEQQIRVLIQSSEVLLVRLESLSDEVGLVAQDVSVTRALIQALPEFDANVAIPRAAVRSAPILRRVARRLRRYLRWRGEASA